MKTLIVNIDDSLAEKAIIALLDALNLEYEIGDRGISQDETERIMANPYLVDKLNQGLEDMKTGKGRKIALEDLWK